VSLDRISDDKRKPESDLLSAFEKHAPLIFGALLDGLSTALRNQHTISFTVYPRLADFAACVSAAETAFGWAPGTFLKEYLEQRRDAAAAGLESDEIGGRIRDLVHERGGWYGTAKELLAEMNQHVPAEERNGRYWPQSPKALSNRITEAAPFLRDVGIEVVRSRTSGKRLIAFRQTAQPIVPIVTTVTGIENSAKSDGDANGQPCVSDSPGSSPAESLPQADMDDGDDGDERMPALSNAG
jgi:hypothetical protein